MNNRDGYEPDRVTDEVLDAALSAYRRHSFADWDETEAGSREVLVEVARAVLRAAR